MDGMEKNELTNHTQPEEVEDRPQPEAEAAAAGSPGGGISDGNFPGGGFAGRSMPEMSIWNP